MRRASFRLLVSSFIVLFITVAVIYAVFKNRRDFTTYNKEFAQVELDGGTGEVQPIVKQTKQENTTCDPFIKHAIGFKVTIDKQKYPKQVPLYEKSSLNLPCLNSSKTIKTILVWTKISGRPFDYIKFGIGTPFSEYKCPVTNCEITDDRKRLSESEIVLFHARNKIGFIPKRTHATQRFVYMVYESMANCKVCSNFSDNVFNYSACQSTDSDYMSIYWTNSGLYYAKNETFTEGFDYSAGKTRMAAARISNLWYATNDRIKYIEWLNKTAGLSVDLYGGGGNLTCPGDDLSCMQYIASNYRFFLAFENSLCVGYATEKLFDWLNYNIIPVVLGFGNYSHFVPKSAYIDALSFQSPSHLVDYLKYLSRNKTAYNEYFKWKKYIKSRWPNVTTNGFFCEMCAQLQLEAITGQVKKKRLTNIKGRYGYKETCMRGELLTIYQLKNMTDKDASSIMSAESWG
jgi:hypothetical protein